MSLDPRAISTSAQDAAYRLRIRERAGGSSAAGGGGGATTLAGDTTGPSSGNVATKASGNFPIKGPRPFADVTHPAYGADPTGTTGDTGAIINSMIAAGIKSILVPAGTYLFATTITNVVSGSPVHGVRIHFEGGFQGDIFSGTASHWTSGVTLKWNGASGGTGFLISSRDGSTLTGGFALTGALLVDGNALLTTFFNFKTARYGQIDVLACRNGLNPSVAFDFNCDGATLANDNTMYITASYLISRTSIGAKFRNYGSEVANCCHITIHRLEVGGSQAISNPGPLCELQGCDNIFIGNVDLYTAQGTHTGLEFGNWGRGCTIAHFQSSGVACYVKAPAVQTGDSNRIIHYASTNNQARPTFENTNARLDWAESGKSTSKGLFINCNSTSLVTGNRGIKVSDSTSASVGAEYQNGATTVRGAVGVFSTAVSIGSFTDHDASLVKNGSPFLTLTGTTAISVADGKNFVLGSTTGTKLGGGTAQKLGFWGVTPVVQPAAIPNLDFVTGATIDSTCRTKVNTILATLRSIGLVAP